MPYHTGVLFMSRADSQPLLDRWGDVILNGWTKSDQKCINQTINELGLTERVGFLDIDKDNFAFINGSVINGGGDCDAAARDVLPAVDGGQV
jgi:hypothetical protein